MAIGVVIPIARVLSASALRDELARLGVPEPARDELLARETRSAIALGGVAAQMRSPLLAAARAHGVAVFERAGEALLVGPALLLREVARDCPPELGAALAAAVDAVRAPAPRRLRHARGVLDLARPVVMGIVNVTPDSFSDAGLALEPAAAIERARRLAGDGAAIVDIGGESTRPGARPVALEEELRRVLPVIDALASLAVPLSIDTRKPEVAEYALAAGAAIVNDVGGLGDERMRAVVARAGAGAVVMHMRGEPGTMQEAPRYDDVVGEVAAFLAGRAAAARAAGIAPDAIALDPGFGFGKTVEHNLAMLRRLEELASLGCPLCVGLSRKSTLGKITGRGPGERLAAGIAAAALAATRGASIVRAHDVRETVDALAVALDARPG